jgi:hypothetical protein
MTEQRGGGSTRLLSWLLGGWLLHRPVERALPGSTAHHRPPLYPKLLRLKNVHPNAWQRAVLGEGMILVGGLLALADVASAWSMVVLPVAVGGVVKAHDVLAGHLARA